MLTKQISSVWRDIKRNYSNQLNSTNVTNALKIIMELNTTQFLTTFLSMVKLYYPESGNPYLQPLDTHQNDVLPEYDFIIVGAGSAGCVVANRLSENPKWNVLLIEAGTDENAISDTPHLHFLLRHTEKDWNYTTVRQERACLSRDGICEYTVGHVMGGSSTLNGMMYVRGHEEDFNGWEKAGNSGWSYKDVLPYFIKAENVSNIIFHKGLNGNQGYQNIEYSKYTTELVNKLIQGGKELGLKEGDYNTDPKAGVGPMQFTMSGPSRESASKAYLNPIKERKNIHVLKQRIVSKIIINDFKAIGVEYFYQNKKFIIKANKEVILSSGSIGSAKLLMLSGIGPKEMLNNHKINTITDLPVGEELQDHLAVQIFFEINKNYTTTTREWKTIKAINKYVMQKTGPLTNIGAEVINLLNVLDQNNPPNFQVMWFTRVPTMETQNKNIIIAVISNIQPKSFGRVQLRSNKWNDPLLIDPNFLKEQEDYDILEKGFNLIFNYMKTQIMKSLSPKLYKEKYPKCNGIYIKKQYIRCIIHNYSVSLYHPVGTAKMGKVVNENLLVKGFSNLRVIDASVIPQIVRGNTNAPTIMIGEKGADIIIKQYG